MTSQPILGPRLPIIHITIRKFLYRIGQRFQPYFSIQLYATVTTEQGAVIIGGRKGSDYSDVATVACFNNSGWSRLDNLQSPRRGHRAIINGDKVYVIGGYGTQ